jgi:hypothetical protein
MSGLIIGIITGLLAVFILRAIKFLEQQFVYGLLLCAFGFLYVGFTWSDMTMVVIAAVQAILFLFIAYFGMKNNILLLAAGYFLHGIWDLVFGLWASSKLLPPHYDLFCLAVDFVMGFYLLILKYGGTKLVTL